MSATGAVAVEGESGKDRRIYVRVLTLEEVYWYVIEEKSSQTEPCANEMPECVSERDRVRRLLVPDTGSHTNNLGVINSRVYLIGGDYSHTHRQNSDDESLGYRYMDSDSDSDWGVVEEWRTGGGTFADIQFGGGVTVGHDGCVYSVGPTLYRLRSGVDKWDKLPIPQGPKRNGSPFHARLLGITKDKLYLYRKGGGVNGNANVMLSFDLQSGKWDDEALHDNFCGDWSPGVVLYEDRYLFSLGTRSPKRKPKPGARRMTRRVRVQLPEEEVPGIYVFDLKQREWLAEPVQGLPNDGTVIPVPYQPFPESSNSKRFSPQLFQIRNDNEHHLAVLWDSLVENNCRLIWCKFILDVSPDTPGFYAHSLSRGFCPLDEKTCSILNCAVGMQARVAAA